MHATDFETLHAIRVGGLHAPPPADADALAARGLVFVSPVGCMLSDEGTQRHAELLEAHRATVDLETISALYDRFLAVNQPVKNLCARWQRLGDGDDEERFVIASELQELLERAAVAITRTAQLLPRFAGYVPRLGAAIDKVLDGQPEYLTSPRVESFHNIWMACHEDYLLTLGISREQEGSY